MKFSRQSRTVHTNWREGHDGGDGTAEDHAVRTLKLIIESHGGVLEIEVAVDAPKPVGGIFLEVVQEKVDDVTLLVCGDLCPDAFSQASANGKRRAHDDGGEDQIKDEEISADHSRIRATVRVRHPLPSCHRKRWMLAVSLPAQNHRHRPCRR